MYQQTCRKVFATGGSIKGGGGILAGPIESDNCVILRPRGKKHVIKDCV